MRLDEVSALFARYQASLGVAEWTQMCEAFTRPLSPTLWVNPSRATSREIVDRLTLDKHIVTPIPFVPEGYRALHPARWGRRIEFRAGLVHLQEASSMLPPLALNPQPGELVLDLCAAPGGKSAQLALMMRHTGTLVVNDLSFERLRALRATQERLGLRNVVLCAQDGRELLAGHPPVFDKVLVDVPCSCEGTLRKRGRWTFDPNDQDFKRSLVETQRALLSRALRLTRPGGRVVYSTCTLDPQENEGVISAVLDEWSVARARGQVNAELSLEPLEIEGLNASEGLTAWGGERWSDELRLARRIYPHQNDTGGFFLASIRVSAKEEAWSVESARSEWAHPQALSQDDEDQWMGWVEARYGLVSGEWDKVRKEGALLRGNKRTLSLVNRDLLLPPTRYQVAGLPVIYTRGAIPRLTSPAALEWGSIVTRGYYELRDRSEVDRYYRGETLEISTTDAHLCPVGGGDQSRAASRSGVYITRYQGLPLGLGELRHIAGQPKGSLKSEYPKRLWLSPDRSAFDSPLPARSSFMSEH